MIFKNSNTIFEQIKEVDNLKKPKNEPFQPFGSSTEKNRTEKNRTEKNRKPNGLDVQKPNGSVFGSVLTKNRTEPRRAHPYLKIRSGNRFWLHRHLKNKHHP